MSDSIKVAIKVRPLVKREKDDGQSVKWMVNENSMAPVDPELKKRYERFTFGEYLKFVISYKNTETTSLGGFNLQSNIPLVRQQTTGVCNRFLFFVCFSRKITYSIWARKTKMFLRLSLSLY